MKIDSFEERLAALRQHYLEKDFPENDIDELIHKYKSLVVNIGVDDEKIARLCQVLTDNGCITYASCEGHAKQLPLIWFFPPESSALIWVSHILQRGSYLKNFPWNIIVDGNLNAGQQLSYRLEPSYEKGPIILPDDYEKLMLDLDIIAVSLLNESSS